MTPHYFQEPVSGELFPQFLQYLPSLVAASVDMKCLGGYPMLTHSSYAKVDMRTPKVSN
jgi:hypothetical protein